MRNVSFASHRNKFPRAASQRARNACLIGGPTGTVLSPCDQIVERVNVWCKAEDDPSDGAPKNNSVTHRPPMRSRIIPRLASAYKDDEVGPHSPTGPKT